MVSLHNSYEEIVAGLTAQGERYKKYRSRMQPGERGDWRIEKFTVKIDLANLRMVRDGRGCSPGEFTRLTHRRRGVVMSDTDAEIDDFLRMIYRAKGRILVAGLGLGLVTQCLLDKPEVEHVTVVEIDADVIALAGSQLQDDRLAIVNADIYEWETKEAFDYAWFDVWDTICGDNWDGMKKLKRKFAREVGACQEAWCEYQCKRLA